MMYELKRKMAGLMAGGAILCLLGVPAQAADNAGAFLDNGRHPVAVGMGNAGVANPRGADAVYWNPAALATSQGEVGLLQSRAFETDFIGILGTGVWGQLRWGAAYESATVSGIPETTLNNVGRYVPTGAEETYQAQALMLGTGVAITSQLSMGMTAKYVQEKAAGYSADGFGADLGARFQVSDTVSLGATAYNIIQPKLIWNTPAKNEEALPHVARLGVAITEVQPGLDLAIDTRWRSQRQPSLHWGVNYTFVPQFQVRAGLDDGAISLGAGLDIGGIVLDIAWVNPKESVLSDIYRFGLKVTLESKREG